MYKKPEYVTLPCGVQGILKSPESKDAEEVLVFEKQIAKESEYMVRYVDEIVLTAKEQARILANVMESPTELIIGVYIDGVLSGLLKIMAVSEYRKASHRGTFSLAVSKERQGHGIANLLLSKCIQYAKQMGFSQLELEAACENEAALVLYIKFGFIIYGTRKNAYRLREQTFLDEYLMYRLL